MLRTILAKRTNVKAVQYKVCCKNNKNDNIPHTIYAVSPIDARTFICSYYDMNVLCVFPAKYA